MRDQEKTKTELLSELKALRERISVMEKAAAICGVPSGGQAEGDRYRKLFDSIRNGLALYEAVDNGNDFVFRDFNKSAEKIDKIKRSAVIGKSVLKVFPGVKDFGLFDVLQRVWKTGKPERHPIAMYRDKRIVGWRENYVSKLPGGEILAVYDDVTRQKQIETILRDRDAYLQSIFSAVPAGIGLVHERVLKDVNRRLCKMLGYRKRELIEKDARILYESDEEYEFVGREKYRQIEKAGVGTVQTRLRRKDGTIIHVLVSSAPVDREDHSKGITFTVLDITEQVQASEHLKKISKAVEQSPSVVAITDREGTIEYVNPKFTKITGYSFEEALNKNPRILQSGEMSQDFYEMLWNTILSGNEWHGEFLNKKKSGELYWEKAVISPVKNEKGEITHFVAVKEDISEKKKLWSELVEAKEKAEESDRLKSCFLANISHEIRTPMNGILGFSELLKESSPSEKEKEHYINLIHQSGKRMLDIINNLIDISRIEIGEIKLYPVRTDVNEVLDNISTSFKQRAKEKGLSFTCDAGLSRKDSVIVTDKTRLNQILSNLIGNALKYTRKGKVSCGYRVINGMLEFYVSDSGIGIPYDMQDKIFDRFRQVSTDSASEYEGTGLGLSLSKTFVEMMGGELRVESVPGKGSVFYFTLPYSCDLATATSTIKAEKRNNISFQQGLTVLVVDDDSTSRMLLKGVLSGLKVTVLVAENGREALEMVEEMSDIGIVLMDMKMPVMNGYEATERIKKIRPELPVIAQTAFASPSEKKVAREAGCDAVLAKPINMNELIVEIQRYS